METVGIGMIGSGYMGRTYAESISRYNEGGRLVAVHGGSRAPGLAEDYGMDFEPSLEALLSRSDVDAVIVASPHQVHADQVIAAADQGKHVLVEKPMATNVADCDAMIAACDDAGVTLSVIQTLRYRGVFSRAKKLIDEGRIGTVRMSQLTSLWTWYHETKSWLDEPESGGSFLDRGAHVCDMLRWLTDDEASSVFAWVGSTKGEAWKAMSAMIQIQFAGGAAAQSWTSHELPEPGFPNSRYLARIYGDKGIIEADGFGMLRVADSGRWEDVWEMPEIDPEGNPYDPNRLEAFYLQTQDFISALREGREPEVKATDGRAAIEMVQAAYLSSLSGAAVRLPLPRQEQGFQFDGATVPRDRIPG